MSKLYKILFILGVIATISQPLYAGNDTKRGQGGAMELLVNPWARSSGWASSNVASVTGVESMFINVAGLSEVVGTEAAISSVRYMSGAGINIFSAGLGQRLNESSVLGISFTNWSLGDFTRTTYEHPEGVGTFSPTLFNLAVSYTRLFSEKISAGITLRGINQSIPSMGSFGVCVDAGIQYRAGEKKEFQIGVTLKNIGPKMRYDGDGLSVTAKIQNPNDQANGSTLSSIANGFELPAQLGIGTGYDFYLGEDNRISVNGTFLSNSFTQDYVMLGSEYAFRDMFMVRAGYTAKTTTSTDINNALSAGMTVQVPLESILRSDNGGEVKDTKGKRTVGINYSFRSTNAYNGTHSLGLILTL